MAGQEQTIVVLVVVVVGFPFISHTGLPMPYLHETHLHVMYGHEASQSAMDVSGQPFPDCDYTVASPRLRENTPHLNANVQLLEQLRWCGFPSSRKFSRLPVPVTGWCQLQDSLLSSLWQPEVVFCLSLLLFRPFPFSWVSLCLPAGTALGSWRCANRPLTQERNLKPRLQRKFHNQLD